MRVAGRVARYNAARVKCACGQRREGDTRRNHRAPVIPNDTPTQGDALVVNTASVCAGKPSRNINVASCCRWRCPDSVSVRRTPAHDSLCVHAGPATTREYGSNTYQYAHTQNSATLHARHVRDTACVRLPRGQPVESVARRPRLRLLVAAPAHRRRIPADGARVATATSYRDEGLSVKWWVCAIAIIVSVRE